jgi:hypothetical protein
MNPGDSLVTFRERFGPGFKIWLTVFDLTITSLV